MTYTALASGSPSDLPRGRRSCAFIDDNGQASIAVAANKVTGGC